MVWILYVLGMFSHLHTIAKNLQKCAIYYFFQSSVTLTVHICLLAHLQLLTCFNTLNVKAQQHNLNAFWIRFEDMYLYKYDAVDMLGRYVQIHILKILYIWTVISLKANSYYTTTK